MVNHMCVVLSFVQAPFCCKQIGMKSFENKDQISFGLMGAASVTQAG
jgi:hypothetical protein